ncbi:MAG: hypothetical protein LBG19_01175 [Prevotellaceae bacterium]|jgi:hypothetical protein|nr:hypothetical protein [Prevotellaceae bacterium]
MVVSQYTHLCKSNDAFIVYNSMSNALLTVDQEIYDRLDNARQHSTMLAKNTFDNDD